jgi:hypothetical protein
MNRKFAVLGTTLGAALAPFTASAAVPAGVEAIFTTTSTDFGTLLGYGYAAMAIIVGGMILLGLVVKVAKRSTRG